MDKISRLNHVHLMRHWGGLISCTSCNSILGYLNPKAYDYAYMDILCKCGERCSFELRTNNKTKDFSDCKKVYFKNTEATCQNCSTPLFSINKYTVYNFSFRIFCKCGCKYDIII